MRIQEALALIEDYAPLSLQAGFDNSGLICGDPDRELTSALLCLDVTEDVVKEAVREGHNLIVSHHPLVFSGLKHLTPATYVERCLIAAVRHTAPCAAAVRRIAVCGGAGASFLPQAMAKGADVYISADFKYHDFFLAENRIVIADIGHYESEQFTKELFYEILTKKLTNFAVRFSTINTNPIKYL